jgi:hypothetical protein
MVKLFYGVTDWRHVLPSYIPLLECSWKVHVRGRGGLTGIVAVTLLINRRWPFASLCKLRAGLIALSHRCALCCRTIGWIYGAMAPCHLGVMARAWFYVKVGFLGDWKTPRALILCNGWVYLVRDLVVTASASISVMLGSISVMCGSTKFMCWLVVPTTVQYCKKIKLIQFLATLHAIRVSNQLEQ